MTTIPDEIAAHRDQLRGDALIDPAVLAPGLRVLVSPVLPLASTPGDDARRMVRHAFASMRTATGAPMYFPDTLGDVGPLPGDDSHAVRIGDTIHVSSEGYDRLVTDSRRSVVTGVRRGV